MIVPAIGRRNRQPEIMDQPELDEAKHRQALAGLGRINRWSGSDRILWSPILALARQTPRPLRVLDVASGGGDVAIALWKRGRKVGVELEVSGCDVSQVALDFAADRARQSGAEVSFFAADALRDPLPTGYDVVTSSLFLHHLDEPDAVTLLRRMGEAAGALVLVNDLRRSATGYLMAYVGTRLLSRSKVVHVDGPRSVEGAFTIDEALSLARSAGLPQATVKRRWPQRFLLSWSRA